PDCRASIAHASMLQAIGILSEGETGSLVRELERIIALHREKKFRIKIGDEDCHTAIENHLTRKLGPAGRKIHAGRSRNDQVLVAIRLYSKDKLNHIKSSLQTLIGRFNRLARRYRSTPVPGYTHSRKAMPFSAGRYFAAYGEAFRDDLRLLDFVSRLTDQNPLGSAAGYGTTLRLNRRMTTRLLGFRKTQKNALYAQNSRGKQVIETVKGLPSGYHRDLQLTKEPLIRGFRKTLETIEVMSLVLENLQIDKERCRKACTEDIYAADRVYELVKKGVAFRDAYRRVSRRWK
ncbi:MAG: hypothetical protein FJY81_02045, partial [Candidatus Aminicenantes bacterium]|nr:hypothetical protein [Candidatus Aminicenantes bacterium]